MPTWKPDPTFYPSPRSAMQAPAETLAYVVRVNPTGDGRPDAITVVDVDPTSGSYGQLDFIWVGALLVVGGLALGLGLWPVLVG